MRRITALIICILFTMAANAVGARGHGRHGESDEAPGRFDYYLLSLSWSPSFCVTHPEVTEQCGKGYGFVLHGLWPQNRDGSWPQHCTSDEVPDEATVARTLAFMPSRHLIEHEWQTHGACTGLAARDYFALADRAFAAIRVPAALTAPLSPPQLSANGIVEAFIVANADLARDMVSVDCHEGELTEVRVCLNKDTLTPQACGGRQRNTCRSGALKIPAVR